MTTNGHTHSQLSRQIGLGGAVFLGLGSIVGTGVFVSLGLGLAMTGLSVLLAVVVAGSLAMANGMASASLAAAHPVSGGTYEYGYRFLGPAAGFGAGWLFMVAKSASAATAALGFSKYLSSLIPDLAPYSVLVSLGLLALVVVVSLAGMRRTSLINTLIVGLTLAALGVFLVSALVRGWSTLTGGFSEGHWWLGRTLTMVREGAFSGTGEDLGSALQGFLGASALIFVAFTGYGRIATLGEEVHDPGKTIPQAVAVTMVVTMVLYALVALGLMVLSPVGQPLTLAEAAQSMESPWIVMAVSLGALTAMAGVLLNLVLGLSRVALAMGRRGDFPRFLAGVKGDIPVAATLASASIVFVLILVGDLGLTWSFSAFSVLLYYGLTTLAALRLPAEAPKPPRPVMITGLVACLGLAAFVDLPVMAAGGAVLAAGYLFWGVKRKFFPS